MISNGRYHRSRDNEPETLPSLSQPTDDRKARRGAAGLWWGHIRGCDHLQPLPVNDYQISV